MAEIFKDLLEAANNDLELRGLKGDQTFDWLESHEIRDPADVTPDEFSLPLPAVLVSGTIVSITPMCLGGDSEDRMYNLTFTILREAAMYAEISVIGDTQDTGLTLMAEELEDLYRRETFNLSDGCQVLGVDWSTRVPPVLGGRNILQAHLTIQHTYFDQRGDSLYRIIHKPSGVQTLSATSQLSPTHPTMLVQSDGGAVTLTSTPTILAGVDGQVMCVMGTSDDDFPTIQDASVLPGSGIKLKGKQSMTFALNDSAWFMYRQSQTAWVETAGRSDVY